MDDLRRAQIAFSQYHQRGLKACESLRNEDFDQALDSLMWRGAAYHNFKVYDERLRISGTDLGRDPKFLSLWKEVDENNTELEALLSIAKKKVIRGCLIFWVSAPKNFSKFSSNDSSSFICNSFSCLV